MRGAKGYALLRATLKRASKVLGLMAFLNKGAQLNGDHQRADTSQYRQARWNSA